MALCAVSVTHVSAQTIFVSFGDMKLSFSAEITPRTLPKAKRAAISVRLGSRFTTRSKGSIPTLTGATIGIDRSLTVDARGVPVCTAGQLENQSTEGAEAACPGALVGTGTAALEIALPGGAPIRTDSTLLAFNGGASAPTTTILVHAYLSSPVVQAIVVPIVLTKQTTGGYGMRALVTVPKIASGYGSLAAVDLTFRRQVAAGEGKKHGYLLARCSDGNFVFAPKVEFEDGSGANGLLAFGCMHPEGTAPDR